MIPFKYRRGYNSFNNSLVFRNETLYLDEVLKALDDIFKKLQTIQLVASGMITAFKKLFLDAWGIKMVRTFRIAILTLLHYPQGALLDMLFQNNAYIQQRIKN